MAWWWPFNRNEKSVSNTNDIRAALGLHGVSYEDNLDDRFIPINSERNSIVSGAAVPAAYAAINLLTDQLSILKRYVVDRHGSMTNHSINGLLQFPSRIVDPIQFWRILIRSYISQGNAYAYIRRNFATKEPIELIPALCVDTKFVDARRSPYKLYTIRLLGHGGSMSSGTAYSFLDTITVRDGDIITLHGPGNNGLYSPSPIAYAAYNIIQTMDKISQHHKNLFQKGMNAGVALGIAKDQAGKYSYEKFVEIRDAVSKQYTGAENTGKIPFLPPGVEMMNVQALSANDLQLIELLRWGVEDIARVFGISPIRIGHYHQGMRARTFESQAVDFERYSIVPHAKTIDSQLSSKLLSGKDVANQYSIMTETDELARGVMTERISAAEMASARGGFWTINEAREATGKKPIDGGDRLLDPKGAPAQNGGSENMMMGSEE